MQLRNEITFMFGIVETRLNSTEIPIRIHPHLGLSSYRGDSSENGGLVVRGALFLNFAGGGTCLEQQHPAQQC
jgi:hypothetical protein